MASSKKPASTAGTPGTFDLAQARWVSGMLNMLIAAVGPTSVLGVVLSQARCEILSLSSSQTPEQNRRAA